MDWRLFGLIWSFEIVLVFGYFNVAGWFRNSKSRADDNSYTSNRTRVQSTPTRQVVDSMEGSVKRCPRSTTPEL